jgi:poly(A) polymerase
MEPSTTPALVATSVVAAALGSDANLMSLGELFARAGYEVSVVGGSVRDLLLGRVGTDIDLTTSANPQEVMTLVNEWADTVWDVGIEFGTVGVRRGDFRAEITTYRAEQYDTDSRKPSVAFGNNLHDDLVRRDFTVNSMAVRLPSLEFVDPFGGIDDLLRKLLRTPREAELSFSDDPLRMLRAARFASQLGFTPVADVVIAATELKGRLEIVSAERIRDELSKLLLGAWPRRGLEFLEGTGIGDIVLPELPALQLEIDEHHRHKDVYEHSLIVLEQAIDLESQHEPQLAPDLVLRLASLLHDIGKPRTRRFEAGGGVSFHHHEVVGAKIARKRLSALRFSNDVIDDVCTLIELHLRFHGYGTGQWTDSAVRRYVRDAGPLLTRLHKLTRADCTTRNQRRAMQLAATYDDLEERIAQLREKEELESIRPDLNGTEVAEILSISAGLAVGRAMNFLLQVRLDEGPLPREIVIEKLRDWWVNETSDIREVLGGADEVLVGKAKEFLLRHPPASKNDMPAVLTQWLSK